MSTLPISSSSTSRFPRRYLVGSGLALMLSTVGYWALMGAHQGWSQNRVPRQATDEVTGLEHVIYENRFLPGVDLLFAGCTAAIILFLSASFLHHRQKSRIQ